MTDSIADSFENGRHNVGYKQIDTAADENHFSGQPNGMAAEDEEKRAYEKAFRDLGIV